MTSKCFGTFEIQGSLYERGEGGYEDARRAAIWNGRKPDRFPDWILVAADERDVVNGVKFANSKGLKIGIRSGGHSVVATGIRDGGLLIDVSRLNDIQVDVQSKTAWVGAGSLNRQLALQLEPVGLTFPFGGSPSVGLGGYLLTGGYGLNGKTYGSGASNIMAIDVVTADGELIRADENTNTEYLWSARGGGYGFFGVVVRFQLRLYDAPRYRTKAASTFSVDDFEELTTWIFRNLEALDKRLMTLIFGLHPPAAGKRVIRIVALGFADSAEETDLLFRPLEAAPFMRRALSRERPAPTTFEEIWAGVDLLYPRGARYLADTCWIKDPKDFGVIAALKPAFDAIPLGGSHIMMNPWIPEERATAVLSGTTSLPFHMYGVGHDPSQDEALQAWITTHMKRIVRFSTGVGKVNESDLMLRDQHVLSPANEAGLEALRDKLDPARRFHSFMRKKA